MKQSNRSAHQVNLRGKTAKAAVAEAVDGHMRGRGLQVKGGCDRPLAPIVESWALEEIEEPDDLAFEGARVSRDPETGRFTRAPAFEDSDHGLTPGDFLKGGSGTPAQEEAAWEGIRSAARSKGWRT